MNEGGFTFAYNISVADPEDVLNQANQTISAVKLLTDLVNNLTSNLNFTNSTDYQQLTSLLADINNLSTNISDIETQYNQAMQQQSDTNSLLQQINGTLQCYSQTKCVTGGPTTPIVTTLPGPCSPNPCKNGGICAVTGNSYTCSCTPPISGQNCEIAACDPANGHITNVHNNTVALFSSSLFPQQISGLNCFWQFRAPPGFKLNITVESVTFTGTNGIFQVLDVLNNNASLYSTSTTNQTAVSVKTLESIVAISFNTASQGASGAFQIQYATVYEDPCTGYDCGNGTCIANGNLPECKCNPCYSGSTCNIVKPNPCANSPPCSHGHCEYDQATCDNAHCVCDQGYNPPFCM
uniref:EGF-like domain-containing protein n=1 Tax=Plectus sambesii TaxID=2011161 RepID=A0A914X8S7_9BILA